MPKPCAPYRQIRSKPAVRERSAALTNQRRRSAMSRLLIARALTGSFVKVRIGSAVGASGTSFVYRFGPLMPE